MKNGDGAFVYQINEPLNKGHLLMFDEVRDQMKDQGFRKPILILHPCGGCDVDENISLPYRIRQYRAFIEEGLLDDATTVLAIWPSPNYLAGPVEALWQITSRVNCGATHFLIEDNQCGLLHPENKKIECYDPDHSEMLLTMLKEQTRMEIIMFRPVAFHKDRKKMEFVNPKKPAKDYEWVSEPRKLRNLATDQFLEYGIMSEECWNILKEYYKDSVKTTY